jgi:ribosomal protein L29
MKITEIEKKSEKELQILLQEKKESLRHYRFNLVGGKVKNVKEGKNIKKDIARIFTVLNKVNKKIDK